MRAVVLAALLCAACDPPSPSLHFRLDDSVVGQCPSSDCAEVDVTCRMWMSIRMIDPAHPLTPFLTQCDEVPLQASRDICSIGGIDLKEQLVPARNLEIQVALFPESMITKDTDGNWVCPSTTQFDAATGFPIASDQTPAAGGRSFYHAGDDKVTVNLGCTDLAPIQSCGTVDEVPVTAEVVDFDTQLMFTGPMTVSVGEPHSNDPYYSLAPSDLTSLTYDSTPSVRKWRGEVSRFPPSYACLAVIDDAPQSTTSAVCYDPDPAAGIRLDWPGAPGTNQTHVGTGIRLSKAALDQLLVAQGLTMFPTHGMTIGLVLDENGVPAEGQVVTASAGTVNYFSADRLGIDLGGKTTKSGAFVSLDAPLGTVFSTPNPQAPFPTVARYGGRIDGKVTVVILQFTGGAT